MLRSIALPVLSVAFLAFLPPTLDAQYFGRNKVQYDQFDFQVLATQHYDLHFYPEAGEVMEDVARMADRWYERMARIFEHEIGARRPLVFYAAHPHFQQTNILRGTVGEGTGGVTEGLQDRIIMPLGATYGDTDHVLGHEIVHSFQFDIAQSRQGMGLGGLMSLPLWFVEGMAEYLSLGSESSLTAMWLRDALLRDDFPTLQDLTRNPQYFPYRWGHAFWAYVGSRWGDAAVGSMLRVATRTDLRTAIVQVLGVTPDQLGEEWRQATVEHYAPLLEGRTVPGEAGSLLLSPATGAGNLNVAPSLSPDGRYLAFLSERDLFTVELFVADARTGEILRSVTRATRDPHFDAIRFIDSSGGWSPDGNRLAVTVFAEGRNQIQIYGAESGNLEQRIRVPPRVGEIRGPVFSPDGATLAFSGQAEGRSDLFLVDVATGELTQLTNDRYAVLQPAFSPDGTRIAFVTDRGPATDFERLVFGPMAIGILDLGTGSVEVVAPFEGADHWNPQFTPDGLGLFFLADPDGFRDIYRVELDGGPIRRLTRLATGVSGITESSPALTVAPQAGSAAFSVFDGSQYHIYALDAVEGLGEPVQAGDLLADQGRRLPGALPRSADDRVAQLLGNPEVGLVPGGYFRATDARPVRRNLRLDMIGQPTIGAGVDQFGTFVAGSIFASFSDILGDRNLFVALQAQGELQDIGGQAFYQDVGRRWNWGGGAAHIPYRYFRSGGAFDPQTGNTLIVREDLRYFQSQAIGQLQYPFSTIRRIEGSAGFTRWGSSLTREEFLFGPQGQLLDQTRESVDTADPLYLGQFTAAFVEDNSYFGFVSPVRGWRSRIEVSQTVGSLAFTQLTVDHRRYFAPHRHLTLAVRGLHIGRYGIEDRPGSPVQQIFLGWESLVRGYSNASFQLDECTFTPQGSCAEFDRLAGHRIGVAGVEARIPVLGSDRFGLLSFPYLPTELVFFTDAGVAWNQGDGPVWSFERESTDRIPVFSSGVSARTSILGALFLEVYYAVPWQRPQRGAHFGVQFVPGW